MNTWCSVTEARHERPHGAIPFIQNAQNRHIQRNRKLISLVLRVGAARADSGMTADGDEVARWKLRWW